MPAAYAPLLDGVAIAVGPEENDLYSAHAIIAGARIRYDSAFMERIPTLKVIARTGIGVDNISLSDATAHGVAICNTPETRISFQSGGGGSASSFRRASTTERQTVAAA